MTPRSPSYHIEVSDPRAESVDVPESASQGAARALVDRAVTLSGTL